MLENSKLNVFKNIKFFGEISDNSPNDLFGTKIYKDLEFFLLIGIASKHIHCCKC